MRKRIGATVATEKRIKGLQRSLKKAGRRGIYLGELRRVTNEQLPEHLHISSPSHLHFLLWGWPKGPDNVLVGGYLKDKIEAVPGMPKNVRFVRLKIATRRSLNSWRRPAHD